MNIATTKLIQCGITEKPENKAFHGFTIFYYIRNALAHGSFMVNGDIYSFESSKDGTTKAAIRLREETLLKWIKDVSLSPEKLKKVLQSERKTTKKRERAA